jgi:hypothetical protein
LKRFSPAASRKRGFFIFATARTSRLGAYAEVTEAGTDQGAGAAAYGGAIKVLAGIMNQADGPATARVAAAQALLDRGWGKASQPLAGEADGLAALARIERVIVDPQEKLAD